MMKIIDFTNQKGGVAKSTVSYNFALYLAQVCNKKVLHLDADEQGNSGDSLSAYHVPGFTSDKFFSQKEITLPNFVGNILAAPATEELTAIEKNSQGMSDGDLISVLASRLKEVAEQFDYVVVDTAGSNSRIANSFLLVTDYVVIPTTIDAYAIKITQRTLKRVIGVQRTYRPNLVNLGLLPTRIDTRSPTVKADLENLVTHYSNYLLPTKTTERQPYRTAASKGVGVWTLKGSGSERDAGKEILAVFDVITKKMGLEA